MTLRSARYRVVKVNHARPDVSELLKELHTECFGDTAPQIEPSKTEVYWIAYHGAEPAGFAGVKPSAQCERGGYMHRSGVLPIHRGHSLQCRLIRAREAHGRRLGWTHLFTDTTNNIPSSNSLIRAGFQLYQPRDPWAFNNSLYWIKEL